jgi:hypothetical protein
MSPGCSGFQLSSARVRVLDVGASMPANIANQPKCSAASSGDFETNVQAVADQLGDHFEGHVFGDGMERCAARKRTDHGLNAARIDQGPKRTPRIR